MVLIFNGIHHHKSINWQVEIHSRYFEQQNNFGTSYRSIGNIQTEYKMHFLPEIKVANLVTMN
jgi:hypothetical protein